MYSPVLLLLGALLFSPHVLGHAFIGGNDVIQRGAVTNLRRQSDNASDAQQQSNETVSQETSTDPNFDPTTEASSDPTPDGIVDEPDPDDEFSVWFPDQDDSNGEELDKRDAPRRRPLIPYQ